MSLRIHENGLTFDDILLVPGYTNHAREDVDLSTKLHKNLTLKMPIISSPMDTVTEEKMAVAMADNGGLGIIHRNMEIKKQAEMVKKAKATKVTNKAMATLDSKKKYAIGAAVGVGPDLEERVKALLKVKTDVIVVDSGHGHNQYIINAIKLIKKLNRRQIVMAGNVATKEGAKALSNAGADILRVGVGPGSICTTRVITGTGAPQIFAIEQALKGAGRNTTIVADGGIRQMGDMAKAMGVGAHAVMLGSMLAGHAQSPGKVVKVKGKQFKQYRGMGSVGAMKKGGAERYGQSKQTAEKKLIPEGVEGLVPYKGKVEDFLYQASGSLRSAYYYTGAKTVPEFHKKATFVRITTAGLLESHPHTIAIEKRGANYL